MIIVALYGGLGNQMFQYAFGKAVAKKLKVELKLDISLLKDPQLIVNSPLREYELNIFNITERIATLNEVRKYVPDLINSSFLTKKLYKIKRLLTNRVLFDEKQRFQFDNKINSIKDNTYLFGYFQTEKYFKSISDELLETFCFTKNTDIINDTILKELTSKNAVSIHVRRSDYINSAHELLNSLDYYSKAIELIKSKVDNPVFYIFSDDINWVEKNFTNFNIDMRIIKNNIDRNSHFDMFLMSKCNHNICANSTFSWWAAWLNTNADKIVITPKRWFNKGEFALNTYDLIPENWVQL